MLTRSTLAQGMTLLELLAVMSIIAALASVSSPVLVKMVHGSKVLDSNSNMRQFYVALSLYRQDHETGSYGKASSMGLPPQERFLDPGFHVPGLSAEVMMSRCPQNPEGPKGKTNFAYYPSEEEPWVSRAKRKEESVVFLADYNCADHTTFLMEFYPKTVYGMRLDGSLARQTRTGSLSSPHWWR